jgi:hypothetical protein
MNDTIIFDLDGTISLDHARHHFLNLPHEIGCNKNNEDCKCKLRDWDAWYDACDTDSPNIPVIAAMNALSRDYVIAIMTGRSDIVKDKTRAWLKLYGVNYHVIYMRPHGDFTEDRDLKIEWARGYGLENILCVYEDRQRMVDKWRELGITCFQVASGNF